MTDEPFRVRKIHGSHTIYLDVIIKGHRFKKSTGIRCTPEQFNKEDQVVRRSHPSKRDAMNILSDFEKRLAYIYDNIESVRYKEDIDQLWDYTRPRSNGPYLHDYIDKQIQEQAKRNPSIENQYKGILRRWEEYRSQQIFIEDVKRKHLNGFKTYLQSRGRTVNGVPYETDGWSYLNGLKAIFRQAFREGLIDDNPFRDFKFEKKKKLQPWYIPPTHQQIMDLIGHPWKSEVQQRITHFIRIMYECQGIEPLDFFLLRVSDLRYSNEDNSFYFLQKRGKLINSDKVNLYLIPEEVTPYVFMYYEGKQPSELLFDPKVVPSEKPRMMKEVTPQLKQMLKNDYKRLVQRYLKPMATELDMNKDHWNFKNLKKAYANRTVRVMDIKDASVLLGHENSSTTRRHYVTDRVKLVLKEKKESLAKLKAKSQ